LKFGVCVEKCRVPWSKDKPALCRWGVAMSRAQSRPGSRSDQLWWWVGFGQFGRGRWLCQRKTQFNDIQCSFLAGTPDTLRGIVYTNSVCGNSEREMGVSQNLPFYHPILGLPDYLHLI
jgi:hypothetical protein